MKRVLFALLIVIGFYASTAAAVPNLAGRCPNSAAVDTTSCGKTWSYGYPTGAVVRTSNGIWKRFDGLLPNDQVLVCKDDIQPDTPNCDSKSLVLVLKSQVAMTEIKGSGSATVSWDQVTRYTNDKPMGANEPLHYVLMWGQQKGGTYPNTRIVPKTITPPETRIKTTITGLTPGSWYFRATAVAQNKSISALSNEVEKVISTPRNITLTCIPATGVESVTAQCAWSAPDFESCEASGGWAGIKASGGQEVIGPFKESTTLVIKCGDITESVSIAVSERLVPPVIE